MKTEQLIGALVADIETPISGATAQLRRLLPWAAVGVGVCFLSIFGIRSDVLSAGLLPTLGKLALGLGFVTFGLVAAAQLTRPDRRPGWSRLLLLAVPAAAFTVVATDFVLLGQAGWGQRLFGRSFAACLTIIPILAAAPLAVSLWGLRSGATTAPATAGALAGIAASGIAITAYGLYCNEDTVPFIATWYILASLLTACLGAFAGRLCLRW